MKMSSIERQKISMGIFFLAFIFFLHTGVALAAQEPRLELKTTVAKEVKVKKDGKWVVQTIPVEKTTPGDILVYTITYLNSGKSPAVEAEIVDPIPKGLAIIPESAEGKDTEIKASLDNGRSWQKLPATVLIKNQDGTLSAKPAPADRYTHVKWTVKNPVQPGQSGRVSFKVTVK
jgi:uncharacterized repeat protein (TIGR01451 family)